MDLFSIFSLCGGLAFFLFGMHVMSDSLKKLAGGRMEVILKRMTSNPVKSLLLGAGITIAVQSSSAVTVMLVGLVNSGIMELGQTIGIIMGSNIGTTLTAWILSLTGIESDNFLIKLLKPESFSPVLALIGIILIMVAKSNRKKDIGSILVGFSVLMYGMEIMKDAVSPLADIPEFSSILTAFTNPLLGVLVGAVFTGVIQSSAASVGILQALSLTGGITYGMAIPIIMGQNIGTCVTALLSSIGVTKNAKRVAAIHVCFNLIGTITCLSVFYLAHFLLNFQFTSSAISPVGIACVHSIFNIATTIILLPFTKQLEKLARLLVKDKKTNESYVLLDDRLLLTPSFAIAQCREMTVQMANLAKNSLLASLELVREYASDKADGILATEDEIDKLEDELGTYLVKISSKALTDSDGKMVSELLYNIGDFERIGDHAVNIVESAQELHEKQLSFSDEAKSELSTLVAALTEVLTITIKAFETGDLTLAAQVEPLEEVIDGLTDKIKARHVARLQNGSCTIELGFLLSDLLTNCERTSDHCSNVAVAVIQLHNASFETHSYLQEIKENHQPEFVKSFEDYQEKYRLAP